MKKRMRLLAVLLCLFVATASATPITSKDDPLLAGAQIIDFTEVPLPTSSALLILGLLTLVYSGRPYLQPRR
jgi:hypothetical protein